MVCLKYLGLQMSPQKKKSDIDQWLILKFRILHGERSTTAHKTNFGQWNNFFRRVLANREYPGGSPSAICIGPLTSVLHKANITSDKQKNEKKTEVIKKYFKSRCVPFSGKQKWPSTFYQLLYRLHFVKCWNEDHVTKFVSLHPITDALYHLADFPGLLLKAVRTECQFENDILRSRRCFLSCCLSFHR